MWRPHVEVHQQISASITVHRRHALALEPDNLAPLGSRLDLDFGLSTEQGDFHTRPQRRFNEGEVVVEVQVAPIAGKLIVIELA